MRYIFGFVGLMALLGAAVFCDGCRKESSQAAGKSAASSPTSSLPVQVAVDGKVTLRIAQWGFLVKYKKQIEDYVATRGMNIEVVFPEPYLSELDDVFNYIRSERADIALTPKEVIKGASQKLINILMPIDLGRLKNYSQLDEQLRNNDAYRSMDVHEGKAYCIPYRADVQTLLYDSARIPAPTSYDVLLKPDVSKKFCLPKYQPEANIRIPLSILGYKHLTYYDADSEDVDWDKVAAISEYLAENVNFAYDIQAFPRCTLVGMSDGQLKECVYCYGLGLMIPALDKFGGKWKTVSVKNGTELWIDAFCIGSQLDSQPEKLRAAYLVIDFMLSEQMQVCVFRDQGYAPVVVGARAKLRSDGVDDPRLSLDFFRDNVNCQAIPRTVRSVNRFKKIWSDAARAVDREKELIP